MKKIFYTITLLSALAFVSSCNKEENAPEKKMTQAEAKNSLVATGKAAIAQIKAEDFRKVATMMYEVDSLVADADVDERSLNDLLHLYTPQFYKTTPAKYWLVDLGIISAKANLLGDSLFVFSQGTEPGVSIAAGNYSFNVSVVSSEKALRIASHAGELPPVKATMPQDSNLFVYAPAALHGDLKMSGTTYARFDLNTDFSQIPDDFTELIEFGTPSLLKAIPYMSVAVSGDICVNGTESYRIHIESLDATNFPVVNVNISVFGTTGAFLASASAKVDVSGLVGNEYSARYSAGKTMEMILKVVESLNVNVLNRASLDYVKDGNLNCYLDGYGNVQIYGNPKELVNNEMTLHFADGTTSTVEDFFTEENFGDVIEAFDAMIEAFREIFDI